MIIKDAWSLKLIILCPSSSHEFTLLNPCKTLSPKKLISLLTICQISEKKHSKTSRSTLSIMGLTSRKAQYFNKFKHARYHKLPEKLYFLDTRLWKRNIKSKKGSKEYSRKCKPSFRHFPSKLSSYKLISKTKSSHTSAPATKTLIYLKVPKLSTESMKAIH